MNIDVRYTSPHMYFHFHQCVLEFARSLKRKDCLFVFKLSLNSHKLKEKRIMNIGVKCTSHIYFHFHQYILYFASSFIRNYYLFLFRSQKKEINYIL